MATHRPADGGAGGGYPALARDRRRIDFAAHHLCRHTQRTSADRDPAAHPVSHSASAGAGFGAGGLGAGPGRSSLSGSLSQSHRRSLRHRMLREALSLALASASFTFPSGRSSDSAPPRCWPSRGRRPRWRWCTPWRDRQAGPMWSRFCWLDLPSAPCSPIPVISSSSWTRPAPATAF